MRFVPLIVLTTGLALASLVFVASAEEPDVPTRWSRLLRSAEQYSYQGDEERIDAFPGAILVPPLDSPRFPNLNVANVASYTRWRLQDRAGYRIELALDSRRAMLLWGAVSQDEARDLPVGSCTIQALPVTHCLLGSNTDALQQEWFFGLLTRGQPSWVTHQVTSPSSGEAWGVDWYDPALDVTYGLTYFGGLGSPGRRSPANESVARGLTEIAAELIPISLDP